MLRHTGTTCRVAMIRNGPAQLFFCFGKRKYFFRFDRSKDHSKTKYFLRFVLVLPKQKIILQVRSETFKMSSKVSCLKSNLNRKPGEEGVEGLAMQICKTAHDQSALRMAVRDENVSLLNDRLDSGENACAKDVNGWFPLHYACEYGRIDCVRLLLQRCPNSVNTMSNVEDGQETSLHLAAYNGNVGCIEALLKYGADIEAREADNATAIHAAVSKGNAMALKCLLDNGANGLAVDDNE